MRTKAAIKRRERYLEDRLVEALKENEALRAVVEAAQVYVTIAVAGGPRYRARMAVIESLAALEEPA